MSILVSLPLLSFGLLCSHIQAAAPELIKCDLTLSPGIVDPREKAISAIAGSNMYIASLPLNNQRPLAITKEPSYVGQPIYGAFEIGNGPKSITYFSIDEAKDFPGKIYVDQNQNGDLTDDGPADWDESHVPDYGRYCMKLVTVHASWGTALEEKESGSYSLLVTKPDGRPQAAYVKTTGRIGNLKLGSKTYPIVLTENTGDGIFTVPADADLTRGPVTLYIDTENNAPFDAPAPKVDAEHRRSPQKFNIGHPFQIDGKWYMARPSISGATLTAQETTAPGETAKAPAVAPDKLPVGTPAPDFTVHSTDGKPLRLADFKGKIVILDFWATWCGPCQASMPSLEKLYQKVKDQNVVVLSVCVLDEKQAFDEWVVKHANSDYHFNFAFDPAGKEDGSIAKSTYEVHAIPAWFLITPDGKIGAKDVGYHGNQGKLIKALGDQKVRVENE